MMRAGAKNIRRMFYALLVVLLFGTPLWVRAQAEPLEARVKLNVQYGFNNNIKSREAVPVCVKVECLSGTATGSVRIEIPVEAEGNLNASIWMSDADGRNNKEQCYIWEQKISLKEGEEAEEVFYIELPMYESYVNISFVSGTKVLDFQQIHCDYKENDSRFLVGIISEHKDEIVQLNGVQIRKDAHYHEDIFVKTLSLDSEDIYENPLALKQLDMLIVDADVSFSKAQEMAIAIWERKGGLYYERNEESLWDVISYYQTGENVKKVQALISARESDSYYNETFDEIPLKEKIPIGKYIFIIVLYLIVIGPGLFWLLKGRKEPYWLIGSVCLISFLFMFLIYLMGRSINMSNPAICHQTIYTQEDEYMHEYTGFSVQAYQMQNFALHLDTDYYIFPKRIGVNGSQKVDVQSAETITFEQTEEETEVLLQNISAYRKNCFSMEKYEKLNPEERITFQMRGSEDALQIEWKNPTNYYLKEAVVVLKNRIAIIGDIKPFSHGSIEDAKLYSYSNNGISVLLNDLLDFSEHTFSEYEIKNMSNIIWENLYAKENADEVSFVIGLLENEMKEFSGNPGFEVYGTSFMKIDVEIDWKNGQIMWYPNLEADGTVYKGEYAADTNLLYSREAILDYETSQVGILESLEFFYPDYTSQMKSALFKGKIYLFNWTTGRFTETAFWNRQFNDIPFEQYVSDTGILRVYYAIDERNMESDRSYILPCIKISGKVECVC